MPFKKVGEDDYTSPSGRHFNQKQVRLWYHLGGKFPGEKGEGEVNKGHKASVASYAEGGPVLGRTRDFLKEPVEFRRSDEGKFQSKDVTGDLSDEDQHYAKSGAGAGNGEFGGAPKGRDKSLAAVKPRK